MAEAGADEFDVRILEVYVCFAALAVAIRMKNSKRNHNKNNMEILTLNKLSQLLDPR